MEKEPIAFYNDVTIKIDERGVAFSLRAREYKDVQCVVILRNQCGEEST